MSKITPITMPKFGLAMTEGKIASWAVAEGATVAAGDEIADVETSKITNAYESPVSGVLRRRVAREQEDLPVGALIAIVADPAVDDAEIDSFITQFSSEFASAGATAGGEKAPEAASVQAGEHTIRYLETGATHGGSPIVLVHGFGGDLNNWLFSQAALAETHRVIAIDLPGHGGSSKSVGDGTVPTLAAALAAFLAALDIGRAHLVGHSLGGAVVLQAALDWPAQVASLTLIAPAGFGPEIDAGFTEGFVAAGRRKQLEPVLAKLFADKNLVSRDMAEDLLRYKRLDGAQAALAAINDANFAGGTQRTLLRDRLRELAGIPVQVVWGELDEVIPAAQAGRVVPPIAVHRLAATGHMPHLEQAARVNTLIAAIAME